MFYIHFPFNPLSLSYLRNLCFKYLAYVSTQLRTLSTSFCFVSNPTFFSTFVKEIFLSRFDLGILGLKTDLF